MVRRAPGCWSRRALLDAAVGGSVAVNDDGRFFNRFMLATPHGDLHQYDKRHLFRMGGEHRHYSAGSRAQIFEWRGIRLCPLVCYDLRFPVWSRRRAQARLRPAHVLRPTGRRYAATRGRRCCAPAPSKTRHSSRA